MNFKQYHSYWKSFSELSSIELYDLLNLRQQVFVEEQECAYIDADYSDQHSDHLLAYDGSQLVGYLRICLLYTSPSPRDCRLSRMPSSA